MSLRPLLSFLPTWLWIALGNSPSKQPLKVFMAGPCKAGKTTILYQLAQCSDSLILDNGRQPQHCPIKPERPCTNRIETLIPRLGMNVEHLTVMAGLDLMAWDVSPNAPLMTLLVLWRYYVREEAEAICLVVDSRDMNQSKRQFYRLAKLLEESRVTKRMPVLVLANKQDLPGARTPTEVESVFNLSHKLPNHPWRVQGICARNDNPYDLYSAFQWLVQGAPTPREEFLLCHKLYCQGRASIARKNDEDIVPLVFQRLSDDLVQYIARFIPNGIIAS